MATTTSEHVNARDRCIELVGPYRSAAEQIIKEEKIILDSIVTDSPEDACKNVDLANLMLNLTSNYIVMNGVSMAILNLRNEEMLHEARKSLYKSIVYLEVVTSGLIDAPFIDYEQRLMQIREVSPAQRYLIIRKMGLAVQLLENSFGDNSKWKWSFVELEGRYATVAKNIMNIRDFAANSNMESEHYEPTVRHLALIKKLMVQAAERYRAKYELSTESIDDFRKGIVFLSALKRFNTLIGDHSEAITTKKKLDTWNSKLTADLEKKEKEKKSK